MNKYCADVLRLIRSSGFTNQRDFALKTGFSLGKINQSLTKLIDEGYLETDKTVTENTRILFEKCKPKNAIILAAGYGLRMVPLNTEIPKGLLEVNGEPLIERTIKQLHEKGIVDIYIVVGYQKEKYEYLMDLYDVELIVNMNYSTRNNLHSLKKAEQYLGNSYIIPCDLYSVSNPYHEYELYDWYMVSNRETVKSSVRQNRYNELVLIPSTESGNAMLGISYLSMDTAKKMKETMTKWCMNPAFDQSFWDDALFATPDVTIYSNLVDQSEVTEIDTFEQLRALDSTSEQLNTSAIRIIEETFHVSLNEITNIETLKKGMTNRSFLFNLHGDRYIMRIPGEGTDMLINRKEEADVYTMLSGLDICDDVLYINPANGYKITRFLEGARNCDPSDENDLKLCMKKLKGFHEQNLQVKHEFDIWGQIDYYEHLWNGRRSMYRDYLQTKEHVLSLRKYIDEQPKKSCLAHIDAVPDNFLILDNTEMNIRLIDWEYAGLQDPHVDIAMFCIYSLYNRTEVDRLIDIYFEDMCLPEIRIKIYCYIAACGLLWSNWCEYKSILGIEFGEYALRQYRYAKDYYKIALEEMENLKMNKANKAIIMAAGKGQRMQPVTLDIPKPMIPVHGVRMIDTIIQALHKNDIYEIYIVIGYLKEKFEILTKEYDGITLIENPYYDSCNNISSLYVARNYIENAIIIDGDQIIHNSDILRPEFEHSGYNSIWTEADTDEWLQTTDPNGKVLSCSRNGGKKGWQLFSISRWTKEDGQKLKHHLEVEFDENKNRQIYWDDVAMFCYPDEYSLYVRPMNFGDLEELDNFSELLQADQSYENYTRGTKS